MARIDYQPIIANLVQPGVVDLVVNPGMDKIFSLFTRNTNFRSGDKISDTDKSAKTANGGAFTRADANPSTLTQDFVEPWWYKTYYHESAVVRREDLDQAMAGAMVDLLTDAANTAAELLMEHVFNGTMTEMKADIDDSSTYSDAAITRTTILQSYKHNTDTQITLSIARAAQYALSVKADINWANYIWLFEQTVYNVARALMSETGSWQEINPRDSAGVATGYLPVQSFDQINVDKMFGMTVGDAFLVDRRDVQYQVHKPFELEMVPVDEYAYKMVARIGCNTWVRRPGLQAKLENKD